MSSLRTMPASLLPTAMVALCLWMRTSCYDDSVSTRPMLSVVYTASMDLRIVYQRHIRGPG